MMTATIMPLPGSAASIFVRAPDGLMLHVRRHGRRAAPGLPVVCLPGLSRTTADFDDVAQGLASQGHWVIAIDSRGRGRSSYDPNPANYSFPVELTDVIATMTALDAAPAVIVGTSRGGLLAMLLGATRPDMIAGVVLNDIGPVVEMKGLMRIKASLGKMPEPRNFAEAAELLRRLHSGQFPKLTPEQWDAFARRTWREENGRLVVTYDPNLSATLSSIETDQPMPTLWKEFDALAHVPVMVIRGATSDILSADTVAAMKARRPDLDILEIPDQGHTPLLAEAITIRSIHAFIRRCEAPL